MANGERKTHHVSGCYTIVAALIGGALALYGALVASGKLPWPFPKPYSVERSDGKLYYKYTRVHNKNSLPVDFQYFDGAAWRSERLDPGAYFNIEVNDYVDHIQLRLDIHQHRRDQPPVIREISLESIVMDSAVPGSAKTRARVNNFCETEPLTTCTSSPPITTYAYAILENGTPYSISFQYLENVPDDWSTHELAPKQSQVFVQTSLEMTEIVIRFNSLQLDRKASAVWKTYATPGVAKTTRLTDEDKASAKPNVFKLTAGKALDLFY